MVEACARLKGGKLAKEKVKNQLQKIALKRTGGAKTDEILGHDSGPEGLPHSIVVTPEGTEGEVPGAQNVPEESKDEPEEPAPVKEKRKAAKKKPKPAKRKKR